MSKERLIRELTTKSQVKQHIFNALLDLLDLLEESAQALATELKEGVGENNIVDISVSRESPHELHFRMAGDTLIFFLHTNIITLRDGHEYIQSAYVQENPLRRYLGQINVYNFMSDSIRYKRIQDHGYLLGRLMYNLDHRFFIEGDRLRYQYAQISAEPINETDIKNLMQLLLAIAIDTDLVAPDISQIRSIPLNALMVHRAQAGSGNKIGFQID
jgi:hypothetical protein